VAVSVKGERLYLQNCVIGAEQSLNGINRNRPTEADLYAFGNPALRQDIYRLNAFGPRQLGEHKARIVYWVKQRGTHRNQKSFNAIRAHDGHF